MTLTIHSSDLPAGAEPLLDDLGVLDSQGNIEWDSFNIGHLEALFASLKRTQGFMKLLERVTGGSNSIKRRFTDGIIVSDGSDSECRTDKWYPIFSLGKASINIVVNTKLASSNDLLNFTNKDASKACVTNLGIGLHSDLDLRPDETIEELVGSGFIRGEIITGQTSNTTAEVVEWIPADNKLKLTNYSGNFDSDELISGERGSTGNISGGEDASKRLIMHAVIPMFQLIGNGLGSVETNKLLWRAKDITTVSVNGTVVTLQFEDEHSYVVGDQIDVKIKKFKEDGQKSSILDGEFTVASISQSTKELTFQLSTAPTNPDAGQALGQASPPVNEEELTRMAFSMELSRADGEYMAADDGFPRFKKLDFDAAFGAKNDGWKIELGAKDFQRKIDDLPSDLELGVDSENPLSDLASGIIETLLQMAGIGRIATHLMPMLGLLESHLAEDEGINWPRLDLNSMIQNISDPPALWGDIRDWLLSIAKSDVAKIWMKHAWLLIYPYGEPKKASWRAYSYCDRTDLSAGLLDDSPPAFVDHHYPETMNNAPYEEGGTMRLNDADLKLATKIWVREKDAVNLASTIPDWEDDDGDWGYLAIRSLETDSHDVIYYNITGKDIVTGGYYLDIVYDEGDIEIKNGDNTYTSLVKEKSPDLDRRVRGEGTKDDPLRTRLWGSHIDDDKEDYQLHNEWGLDLITSFWEDDADNTYIQAGFSFGMENTLGEDNIQSLPDEEQLLFDTNIDMWIVRFKIPKTIPNTNSQNTTAVKKSTVSWFPKMDLATNIQKTRWPNPDNWMKYRYYDSTDPTTSLVDENNKKIDVLEGVILLNNATPKDATKLWMNHIDLHGLIAKSEGNELQDREQVDSNLDEDATWGYIELRTENTDGGSTVSFPINLMEYDEIPTPTPSISDPSKVHIIELDDSMGDFEPANGDTIIVRFHRLPPNAIIEHPEPAKLLRVFTGDKFTSTSNPLHNLHIKVERAKFGITWDRTGELDDSPPDIILYDDSESKLKKGTFDLTNQQIVWDDSVKTIWKPSPGTSPSLGGSTGLEGTWSEWNDLSTSSSTGESVIISKNTTDDKFLYDISLSSSNDQQLIKIIWIPKKWKPIIELKQVDIGDLHRDKIDLATPDGWLDLADLALDGIRDMISDALASNNTGTSIFQWLGSLFGFVAPRRYPFRKCDVEYEEGFEYKENQIIFYDDGSTERVYLVTEEGESPTTPFGHTPIRPLHDNGYAEIGTSGLIMRYLGENNPVWETNNEDDLRIDFLDLIKQLIEDAPTSEGGVWWLQSLKNYYHRLATTELDPYGTGESKPALLYIVEAFNFSIKQILSAPLDLEEPNIPVTEDIRFTGSGSRTSPYRMSIGDDDEGALPWFNTYLMVKSDEDNKAAKFEFGLGCTAFLLPLWDVFCLDFGIDVGLISLESKENTITSDGNEIDYIETGTSMLTGVEIYAKMHDPFNEPAKQITLFDMPGMQFTIDGLTLSGYWRRPHKKLLKNWVEDSVVARDSVACPNCNAAISEPCFDPAKLQCSSRVLDAANSYKQDCTECPAKGKEDCIKLGDIHEERLEEYSSGKKFGWGVSIQAPRLGSIAPDFTDIIGQLSNPARIGGLSWDGEILFNQDGDAVYPDLDDFLGASDDPPMETIEISPRNDSELPIPVDVNWDYFGAACEEIGYDSLIATNKGIYGLISESPSQNAFIDIDPGTPFYENESIQMLIGWLLAFKGGKLGFAFSTFFRIHPHLIHLDLLDILTKQAIAFELPESEENLWPQSWKSHHQKGRAQLDLGLGPLSLPYDWPQIVWKDLIDKPVETIKEFIVKTLTETSSGGEPFAFSTFRWLSAILNDAIPSLPLDDATLGWPTRIDVLANADGTTSERVVVLVPEIPMGVSGDGTFENPWAVRLSPEEEKAGRILFWVGPDGPKHDSMLEGVMSTSDPQMFEALQKISTMTGVLPFIPNLPQLNIESITDEVMISSLAEVLIRLSHHSERVRSALGDTSKARLQADLLELDAFLKISDGVSEVDSQLSVDEPSNLEPTPTAFDPILTGAAYSLDDTSVHQQVQQFVSTNLPANWIPGKTDDDLLLLVGSDSNTKRWESIIEMLLKNHGSPAVVSAHYHPSAHPLTYAGPEDNSGVPVGVPACSSCGLIEPIFGVVSPISFETEYSCELCQHNIDLNGDCQDGTNCDVCENSLQDLQDYIYSVTSPFANWEEIRTDYIPIPGNKSPKSIILLEIDDDTTELNEAVNALTGTGRTVSIICHGEAGLAVQDYVDNWDETYVKGVLTINTPYHGVGTYNSALDLKSILRAMSFIHRSKMGDQLGPATKAKAATLDEEYQKGDTIYHVDSGTRYIFKVTMEGIMDVIFSTVYSTVDENTPIGAKFLRLTLLGSLDNETYLKTLNLQQLSQVVKYAHEPFKNALDVMEVSV